MSCHPFRFPLLCYTDHAIPRHSRDRLFLGVLSRRGKTGWSPLGIPKSACDVCRCQKVVPKDECHSILAAGFRAGFRVVELLVPSFFLPSPPLNNAETNMNLVLTRMNLPTRFP